MTNGLIFSSAGGNDNDATRNGDATMNKTIVITNKQLKDRVAIDILLRAGFSLKVAR